MVCHEHRAHIPARVGDDGYGHAGCMDPGHGPCGRRIRLPLHRIVHRFVDRSPQPGQLVVGQPVQHMPPRLPNIRVEVAGVPQFLDGVRCRLNPRGQRLGPLIGPGIAQLMARFRNRHGERGMGKKGATKVEEHPSDVRHSRRVRESAGGARACGLASAPVTRIGQRILERPYAWVLTLAIVLRLPTLVTRLFDADEAAIGVQGLVVRSGGTLYRDIFDRKPPLPPLAYAASFSLTDSTDVRPMRVLVTVLLALGGLLMAHEAKRRWGTNAHAAWAGTLFVAGAMAFFPADAGGANYAHFALVPGAAALLWSRRSQWFWGLAAGAAFGLALLTRQSWALALPAALYSAWCAGRWRNMGLIAVGTAATVSTVALYAPFGAYWEWNFTNSPGFVLAAAGVGISLLRGLASSAAFIGFHITMAVCLWLTLRTRNPLRAAGRDDRDLWVWLLSGLAAVAAGFRFFGHYWLQVLPPLVVLTTPLVASLAGRARRLAIVGVAVPAAVACALLFVPGSFHRRPDPTDLAAYVHDRTDTDQRVFIWGSFPEVLVKAERLPAGALVHTDFVTGRSGGREDPEVTLALATPGAMQIMMDDLHAHPPALVLDTSTTDDLGYANYPMTLFAEVAEFVYANYEQVTVIDGVSVWQLVTDI